MRLSCNSSSPDAAQQSGRVEAGPIFRYQSGSIRERLGPGGTRREVGMRHRGLIWIFAGLLFGGCTQTAMELSSDSAMTPRDKQLLANARYAQAAIPDQYKRQVVTYHRKELP